MAAGLIEAPALARRAGLAGIVHVAVTAILGVAYLVLSAILIGVLWAPIGLGLMSGEPIDATVALLLVGFVAIWLCLVLAGGALHAWGSATWWTLLQPSATLVRAAGRQHEAPIDR